ncbi:hypothetical protein GY24_04175 [Microterricola pindariensis]|uniref:SIR2-like domain-containing protein n=1 Tax=Microterricola pindariensis TaxID=478010 RepID=A0ABX5AZL5_9MICO|nr:hypothetical protein GY24_04175 [Microterricola pindariensis]
MELLGGHKDVDYFEPLLDLARTQPGGADVITLNYDLTIETAAATGGVAINRGIESWRPGENLDIDPVDGTLNLLKLHGSLDWRPSAPQHGSDPQLSPRGIEIVNPGIARDVPRPDLPWIVVGDREKLATDGPTLALNFAARSALLRTNHLAVIGYSFGDAHINAMIRDWLAADPARTMSVLDVRWPREKYYRPNLDFRSALIARYGRHNDSQGQPILPRVVPLEGLASERFADVLRARPEQAADPLASAVTARDGAAIQVKVTWHGPDLAEATLSMWPETSSRYQVTSSIILYEDLPAPSSDSANHGWAQDPWYQVWPTGVTKTVYVPADTVLPVELRIEGASIVGAQGWTIHIHNDIERDLEQLG